MSTVRQALALYARIGRTYVSWAGSLLPLAVAIFVPLGLIHAIPVHLDVTELDLRGSIQVFAVVAAVAFLTVTGLIGEVFYTGAVAISLTHPHDGRPPSLREIARTIKYGRLIAVDLIYAVLVAVGTVLLFVPGVLAFVFLGLAAPVVEIERRGVREALRRSVRLVHHHFWLVLAVLFPIEVVGDAATNLLTHLGHLTLGDSLIGEWVVDTASNIVLTPFYAVAAVLLTIDLIAAGDEVAPRLHSRPASQ